MSNEKLRELSKPVGFVSKQAQALWKSGDTASIRPFFDVQGSSTLYSQEYVSALLARITELESTEIKPEGMRLMSEAIGAHGYIVGCLVQGRPDLALEESRKWVDAFSQAAELINNG